MGIMVFLGNNKLLATVITHDIKMDYSPYFVFFPRFFSVVISLVCFNSHGLWFRAEVVRKIYSCANFDSRKGVFTQNSFPGNFTKHAWIKKDEKSIKRRSKVRDRGKENFINIQRLPFSYITLHHNCSTFTCKVIMTSQNVDLPQRN